MKNRVNNGVSKRAALFVVVMSSFVSPFLFSSVSIALPSIGRELALDAVTLSWVATSYLLTSAMFLVPFGRISDIHGRKRIFTYGMIIYTIAPLLVAISTSGTMLISFRVLQGIGSAMISGTLVAILTSVFPLSERGKALGIYTASVYVGLSVGPALGGFLTQYFGWRSIFLAIVPLGLAIIATVIWKLKGEWAEAKGEKFDLTGSIIYCLALAAIMYGFSLVPAMSGVWLIVIGSLGILAFIKWETRAKSPVLSISLFKKNTAFSFSNLAALIYYTAAESVTFLLSLYLQYIKGFSPQYAGLILVSRPLVMAVLSPVAGRLSDRIEPRIVASVGMTLTTIGLVLLTFLSQNTGLEFILASLIILGLGFAFFSSPNMNAIMSSVERKFYGVAAGTSGTMRQSGQMLGMGIAMLLFALYIGRVQITPEYYPLFLKSAKTAFAISAALCFGGILVSLARGKRR